MTTSADEAVRLERVLLGSVMDDPHEAAPKVLGSLRSPDYLRPQHGRLHDVLAALYASGDLHGGLEAVYGSLQATGSVDDVGGFGYVGGLLSERTPSPYALPVLIAEHARYASRHRLAEVAHAVESLARGASVVLWGKTYDPPAEPRDLIRLSTTLHEQAVRSPGGRRHQWTTAESLTEIQRVARERAARGEVARKVISTGIPYADDNLRGGWRPGQLVVIPGRPGTGKTAAALGFALAAAMAGERVAFFSLEMEHHELTLRLLAQMVGATVDDVEIATTGTDPDLLPLWTQQQWDDLLQAEDVVKSLPLRIDDEPGRTVADIAATCEAWRSADGALDLVVVDYLQLMDHGAHARHDIAVGNTSKRLKELAKRLECPVLLLSQLNRKVEDRADPSSLDWVECIGRPRPSDLRDSGAIEQDADVILAPMHARREHIEATRAKPGEARFLVLKQRGGMVCDIPVQWIPEAMRYCDPDDGALPDDLL